MLMINKSMSMAALVAFTSIVIPSCKEEKQEIKTKKGATIILVGADKKANRSKPDVGKIITLHLTYRNSKDSIFFSSHTDGKPATGKTVADSLVDPIAGAFGYLMEGDTADILIPTDSLFKGMMAMQRPPFLPAGSTLKLGVKVLNLETEDQLNERKAKEIEKYIADHKEMNFTKTPGGVYVAITEKGLGKPAAAGDSLKVHYRGHLLNETKVFDESYLQNRPFDFVLKYGNVIPGWHEGFDGVPAGSKVTMILPYAMAYGENGSPEIPPYSTLQFECDLLKVTPGKGAPVPQAPLMNP